MRSMAGKAKRASILLLAIAVVLLTVLQLTVLADTETTHTTRSPYYVTVPIEEGWSFEYSLNKDGNFLPMQKGAWETEDEYKNTGLLYRSGVSANDGEEAALQNPYSTDLYITPGTAKADLGYGSLEASQTYTMPYSGFVTVDAHEIIRHYGEDSEADQTAEYAIFKNGEKLWPEGTGWMTLSNANGNRTNVPALRNIRAAEGDKLRFVIARGEGGSYNDLTKWYVTLHTEKSDLELGETTDHHAPQNVSDAIEEGWSFEYSVGKDGSFLPMQKTESSEKPYISGVGVNMGEEAALYNPWNNLWYITPGVSTAESGYASIEASQTFTVPANGFLTVDAHEILRHYGDPSEEGQTAEYAIFQNGEKLWPEGAEWMTLSNANNNKVTVPKISDLRVAEGDKIRFVVARGAEGNVFNDLTRWYPTLHLTKIKPTTTTTESTTTTTESTPTTTTTGSTTTTTAGETTTTAESTTTTTENTTATTGSKHYVEGKKQTWKAPTYFTTMDQDGVGSRWIYEYAFNKDFSDIRPMDPNGKLFKSSVCIANETASLASPWNTDLYIMPGMANRGTAEEPVWVPVDAIQTFVASVDGRLSVDASTIVRRFGSAESGTEATYTAEYAIYLNDQKIWPADDAWAVVSSECGNKLEVPALNDIRVKKGDRLRFAVNAGAGSSFNDLTQWYVTVHETELIETDDPNAPDIPAGDMLPIGVAALCVAMAAAAVILVSGKKAKAQ